MKLRSSVYGWKSVWMDLADELNGSCGENKDDFKLSLPLDALTLTFRMHHSAGSDTTTAMLPFSALGDFTFAIHNKSWIEEAAKPFGLQDIVVGFADFDREYIIQGNNEPLVKQLFADESVRAAIEGQKSVRLQLVMSGTVNGRALSHGVHAIVFEEKTAINSFERMTAVCELMKAIVKRLAELKLAKMENPGFEF